MSYDEFTGWRTSSYSGDGNSCVELAATRPKGSGSRLAAVGVRDTKRNGRGPVLEFSAQAWREFLGRVKNSAI